MKRSGGYLVAFLITALTAVWLQPQEALGQAQPFDILIRNGRVFDGSGNPWTLYDVGIRGDEIVALGHFPQASAGRIIDAGGLYVAPGFIDIHSHADRALAHEEISPRRAASLVSQGLTTVVGGPDGGNVAWPLPEEIAAFESQGMGMNLVLMVGHGTIRREVMGEDYEREATPAELDQMKDLLRQGMESGAWGLGAGIEYRPARFSSPEEVIELARVVADYDGFYVAHQRSEATMPLWQLPSQAQDWPVDGLQGLQETIEVARQTGIRVVASHHKARGRSSFGRAAHDTILVNKAREEEGLEVYLDVYSYETFGGGPRPMIPKWTLVDEDVDVSGGRDSPVFSEEGVFDRAREHLRGRWADPVTRELIERDIAWIVDHNGGADRVVVTDYPDDSFVGKTLAELARERGKTFQEIVVEMQLNGYEDVVGGAWTRGYGIHDVDVEAYIRQDYTATSSDAQVSGIPGIEGFEGGPGSHPRHFGAFVRKLAYYVKDKKVISLAHGIRAATGLPAQIIRLPDRGLIREGYKADIVIFDLERLRDRATVLEPELFSEGIEYVMVNGELTVDSGNLTGALPGVVVRKQTGAGQPSS